MENQINIAKLLKDCPKGTKLYCSLFPVNEGESYNVTLKDVESNFVRIQCYTSPIFKHETTRVNQYGEYCSGGECLLSPSKDNRDWSTFKIPIEEQSKFKVGDVVVYDDVELGEQLGIILADKKLSVANSFTGPIAPAGYLYDFKKVIRLATPEEIANWNEETLQPNHLHYSKSKRKIIDWLLPFDKVVVKIEGNKVWHIDLFERYNIKAQRPYCCLGNNYDECLPYNEKTAKLIGTTNDWEEK